MEMGKILVLRMKEIREKWEKYEEDEDEGKKEGNRNRESE